MSAPPTDRPAPTRAAPRTGWALRAAWTLGAVAVLCQIAYPLLDDGPARDRLTIATVAITFVAVAAHALARLGLRGASTILGTVLVVATGVEVVGVHTGVPFGGYSYGPGLGPRLAGVPLAVPVAWAMTAYPALLVARRLVARRLMHRQGALATALIGGWALATWDLFLDPQMVTAGHWTWADPTPGLPGSPGVPLTNYAGWLVVSVLLMALLTALLHSRPALRGAAGAGVTDLFPGLLYLWTYAAQVLANLVFFDRPAVALLGGVAMGAVALPYARSLRRT